MKRILNTLLEFINKNLIYIAFLITYCAITYNAGIPGCISKLIFGVPCPGCGITRACISLICFDFVGAFYYNPAVFLLPFIFIIIVFRDYKYIKKIYWSNIFWIIIVLAILVSFVLRMIFIYPNEPLNLNEHSLLFLIINVFKSVFGIA